MQIAMPYLSISICCLCTIILAHISTLNIPSFVNSKTLESDIQVLRLIKQSLDPNSISSTSFINTWNFAIDPCETTGTHFLGILCTIPDDDSNSSSRISAIDLEGDGLEGFLTPDIGNLTDLTVLNLRKNKFRGPLPTSIYNLRKITTLLLSENFFSGSISNSISKLKKLEIMDLSVNRLSGSIPGAITGLRSLTHLILSKNELSGKIPGLIGLWQLNTLDLSSNQLYGNLPMFPINLRVLLLGHNLLSGHISYVARLHHIQTIDLSDNRFTGSINTEMLTLPELIQVNVSVNHFMSVEVINYSNRPSQLQVLDATNNRLHGHLPMNLITYENLTAIHLGHNLFSGRIPMGYGERLASSWSRLFLDYNFLEGSLPAEFKSNEERGVKGSLAHNCLTCPINLDLCHGGQRAAADCVGHRLLSLRT